MALSTKLMALQTRSAVVSREEPPFRLEYQAVYAKVIAMASAPQCSKPELNMRGTPGKC
ncbi:MAG: hypothetical protein RSD57_10405 [Comamonas sp.]